MTNIIATNSKGKFSIKIEGHSGYADSGKDIVCSAVSVLAFTLLNEIQGRSKILKNLAYEIKDAYFQLSFDYSDSIEIRAVLHTIMGGLNMVAEQYPEYVCINLCPNGGEIFKSVM